MVLDNLKWWQLAIGGSSQSNRRHNSL